MKYLILKISTKDAVAVLSGMPLKAAISKPWRIGDKKTREATQALVVYAGTIIGSFTVTSRQLHASGMMFGFKPLDSFYIGHALDYSTSNGATVVDEEKLKEILRK